MIDAVVATTTTITDTTMLVTIERPKWPCVQAVAKFATPPGAPVSWPRAEERSVARGASAKSAKIPRMR